MTSWRVSASIASMRAISAGPMVASFGAPFSRMVRAADSGMPPARAMPSAANALNLEPDPVAIFRSPDRGHFRTAVTRHHATPGGNENQV